MRVGYVKTTISKHCRNIQVIYRLLFCAFFSALMKQRLLLLLFFSVPYFSLSQHLSPSQKYRIILGNNSVEAKNYYLLALIQANKEARTLLETDSILVRLARTKVQQLKTSLSECKSESRCYTERMKFSPDDIRTIGSQLARLYSPGNALGKLVTDHLIPSGTYYLYKNLSPDKLLVKAWEQDAAGINFAIGVYAQGQKPNYPAIDSIGFNVRDARYVRVVNACTQAVWDETRNSTLFFEPSLTSALRFLEINEREHAADFEPMATGENRAAYEKVAKVNWSKYPYTVILVPGAGPDDPTVPLSASGMLRCRVAALRYREGMAPFVVVSGGRVHPYKTRFSEAFEMKRYLMAVMGIPEDAIIIEPHARHTTTNMRNCARLIYRYGMPFDKPCLASTTKSQSYYITDGVLEKRCQQELGYVPYRNGKRLSDTESEFYPLLESLQINPTEPLDP